MTLLSNSCLTSHDNICVRFPNRTHTPRTPHAHVSFFHRVSFLKGGQGERVNAFFLSGSVAKPKLFTFGSGSTFFP